MFLIFEFSGRKDPHIQTIKHLRQCILLQKAEVILIEVISVIRSVDIVSVKTYDLAKDLTVRIVEGDGRIEFILREEIWLTVLCSVSLDCSFFADKCSDDIALVAGFLLPDDDIVSVKDMGVDHTCTAYLEDEAVIGSYDRLVDIL